MYIDQFVAWSSENSEWNKQQTNTLIQIGGNFYDWIF